MDFDLWFKRILYFIVLPVVSISFIITSMTNDLRIYLGVENIATHYFPFPQGVDLAWEIKPIMNRLINYIFYNIATSFVPLEDHFWFGVAVKSMALVIIALIAWYFSRQINIPYTFAIVFMTLTTCANFFIMQAEYWSVAFSFFCIALLVKKTPLRFFVAGCLIPVITLFKGISGLMLIPILCAVFLLDDKPFEGIWQYVRSYKWFIAGFFAASTIFLIAQFTIWTHIISDAIMSPYLANAGLLTADCAIVRFIMQFVLLPLYFPIMVIGITFGFYYIVRLKYLNDRYSTIAYILMWVVPILILIPQGEYFMYQFEPFGIPAVITLILSERCLLQ